MKQILSVLRNFALAAGLSSAAWLAQAQAVPAPQPPEIAARTYMLLDVTANPKKLKFVELEAAQLPRSLDDLDAAAVNSSYAVAAGLSPQKDALALEATDTPYVTVLIATRAGHEKHPGLQAFVKAYQSPEVRQFIETQFKGAYTAAW